MDKVELINGMKYKNSGAIQSAYFRAGLVRHSTADSRIAVQVLRTRTFSEIRPDKMYQPL